MPRAVIDTNILISGVISPHGCPRAILEHWHDQDFVLVISQAQMAEVEQVMEYPHLLARLRVYNHDRTRLLHALQSYAETVMVETVEPVCRDPDDDLILASAVAGKADYLVSGDKDLLVLEKHRGVRIVTAAQFLHEPKRGSASSQREEYHRHLEATRGKVLDDIEPTELIRQMRTKGYFHTALEGELS